MTFALPPDLFFNRGNIADPANFARERGGASWLYLCGTEFAAMEGGMSFDQVQRAVPVAVNVISDPPRVLDLELARKHVAALDELPRPTIVSCRAGPRSSAVIYLYTGLRAGAEADAVIAAATRDGAPFAAMPDLVDWVRVTLEALRRERA